MIIDRKHPCPACGASELWVCHGRGLVFHHYFVECAICHCCGKNALSWKGAFRAWRDPSWRRKVETHVFTHQF